MTDQGFREIVMQRVCTQIGLLKMVQALMIALGLFMLAAIYVTSPGTASHALAIVNVATVAVFAVIIHLIIRYCEE